MKPIRRRGAISSPRSNSNDVDPATYDYVDVSARHYPRRSRSTWRATSSSRRWSTPASSRRPTELGTYPVYERFLSTTMTGTNPDGTHYSDPDIPWVSLLQRRRRAARLHPLLLRLPPEPRLRRDALRLSARRSFPTRRSARSSPSTPRLATLGSKGVAPALRRAGRVLLVEFARGADRRASEAPAHLVDRVAQRPVLRLAFARARRRELLGVARLGLEPEGELHWLSLRSRDPTRAAPSRRTAFERSTEPTSASATASIAYSSSIPKGSVWELDTLVRSSKRTMTRDRSRHALSLAQRPRDDAPRAPSAPRRPRRVRQRPGEGLIVAERLHRVDRSPPRGSPRRSRSATSAAAIGGTDVLGERRFVDAGEIAHVRESELGELRRGRRPDAPQRRAPAAPRATRASVSGLTQKTPGPSTRPRSTMRGLDSFEASFAKSLLRPSPTPQRSASSSLMRRRRFGRRLERPHVQAPQAAQVGEGLVEPERFEVGREIEHDVVELTRVDLVAVEASRQDDEVGTARRATTLGIALRTP